MNTFILCILGLALVASSYACTIASECSGSCDLSSNHWACINHACECRPNGNSGTCSQKDDCRAFCGTQHTHHYHCIDGKCKCGELGD